MYIHILHIVSSLYIYGEGLYNQLEYKDTLHHKMKRSEYIEKKNISIFLLYYNYTAISRIMHFFQAAPDSAADALAYYYRYKHT